MICRLLENFGDIDFLSHIIVRNCRLGFCQSTSDYLNIDYKYKSIFHTFLTLERGISTKASAGVAGATGAAALATGAGANKVNYH